jgi:hypothetical protein
MCQVPKREERTMSMKELGVGHVLTPEYQERAKELRRLTEAVQHAQTELIAAIRKASDARVPSRAIATACGTNHERIRRLLSNEMEVRPF